MNIFGQVMKVKYLELEDEAEVNYLYLILGYNLCF
jgi:hypothetical protein